MRRFAVCLIARHARKEIPMLYVAGVIAGLVLITADVCARACQRFRDGGHR